jgi:ABC-2 type transport system ATP-binding protein
MDKKNGVVIETHGLSKSYNGVEALKPLNLQVPKNSIFGFLGPNGSGKSTTIKLLLGLLRPSDGSGTVFGLDIVQKSPEIRTRVGYLAQDQRFYGHMTARETLRFTAGFFYTGPKAEIENRIDETLELVDLAGKADRPIQGFSGGERQRLGIAQAQINYPDLLILDEPAAALDPKGRHDVLEILERLRKYSTIFFSTHILDDVQKVSDAVAILNHGELVALAPIEELLAGSGNIVYTITTKGDGGGIQTRLSELSWVTDINRSRVNGGTRWQVIVDDEAAAEAQLLRSVQSDSEITVSEFGRKKFELEEIFLRIIEESNHDSN